MGNLCQAIAITSIRLGWPEPRLSLLLDVLAENICALVGTLKGKFALAKMDENGLFADDLHTYPHTHTICIYRYIITHTHRERYIYIYIDIENGGFPS